MWKLLLIFTLIPMKFSYGLTLESDLCKEVIGETCQPIYAFQPDLEKEETNVVYDIDDGTTDFDFSMYGNFQKTILVRGIPYAQYWQLKNPSQYVFHPMVFGRYVFNQSEAIKDNLLLDITDRAGTALAKNNGIAFYYPNYYPLNRMRGPDVVYSAISQSEILAGYLQYYLKKPTKQNQSLLQEVFKPLFFPYEKGGVDLGVAQLEFPLFRSNPEIILNGWFHSLLHLTDYAMLMNDKKVAAYIRKNLQFFVDNHSVWYDEKRNISRYSDTSPIRVRLDHKNESQEFYVT